MPGSTTVVSFCLAALFFVAFLPQFVSPAAGSGPMQILVLGGFAERVRGSRGARRRLRWTTGGVYLGLAGLAVLT